MEKPTMAIDLAMKMLPYLTDFVLDTLPVLVGAWLAFALERRRRNIETKKYEVALGNELLFKLFQMWNILKQYQKEVIKPVQEQPLPWFSLRNSIDQFTDDLRIDAEDCGFLFRSDDPDIVSQIMIEQRRFNLAISLIKKRSQIMLEDVFPALSKAGVKENDKLSENDLVRIAGKDKISTVKQLGESIIQNVNEDSATLVETYRKLRGLLKKQFPNSKFIQVSFDQEKGN